MLIWLHQLIQDARFGLRTFARTPAATLPAILSLALGIMATTAIYSVIHAVVLDPFPYRDVDALMSVRVSAPEQPQYRTNYSIDQFLEIAQRSTIFEGVIASTISDVLWTGEGDPQRLRGNYGTPNTFLVMGVPAHLGRSYAPDDMGPDRPPVAVLGYRFWQRQFGGDPNIVGRQLKLNDRVRTVIGVMPKRFMWRGADVYLPVVFERGRAVEGIRSVHLLGRLKAGVTDAQAQADLQPIIDDLVKREPQGPTQLRVGLLSFKETFPSSIRDDLWILFGAVGLLLLIACTNVSNLLLSRAAGRQREMAVRAALGGGRARLVRQLLTESLLLALAGGLAGTALAVGALRAILSLVPPGTIPDESEVALNLPVLFFALAVSAATSLVFGLAPALHTCRRDLAHPLRSSGRGFAGGGGQALLRKGLVVGGVALSIMLMVGASLMIRTVVALGAVDFGFDPERVLTLRVPLPEQKYPDMFKRVQFFDEVIRNIGTVPGVGGVAVNTSAHPFGNIGWAVDVPGIPDGGRPQILHQVSADYTKVLGIPLLRGRLFTSSEVESRRQVALINESFERTRLQGQNGVGRIVRMPRLRQPPIFAEDDLVEIVGVVGDTLNRGVSDGVLAEVYIPYSLLGAANRLVVRTPGDASAVTRAVVERIYAVDRDQPVTEVRTIADFLGDYFYAGPRFNVVLLSVFAGLGLVLAVVGVYGVMSSMVVQQTREIGVRIALGADPSSVAAMIVKSGAVLLLTGTVAGLAGSVFAVRLLAGQIWNVSPVDPVSFAAVSLVLFAAGLQACAWPAWRAARTQPVVALRLE
jgi:putative ABC transport system permease protein